MLLAALSVSPALCTLGAVQVLGVAAAAVARVTEGSPHERIGQRLCLAGLALIGTACGVAIRIGPGAAASCAVTLAVMTLVAVVDLGPRRG